MKNFKKFNEKAKRTSKILTFLAIFCIFFSVLLFIPPLQCYADTSDKTTKEEIYDEINNQLSGLDLEEIEKLLEGLDDESSLLFGSSSFVTKITNLMTGNLDDTTSFLNTIIRIFFGNLSKYIPLIATIIAISVLGGIIDSVKPLSKNGSISSLVHFAIYGLVLIIVGTSLFKLIGSVSSAISSLKAQTDAILPVLLTLLSGLGGNVSVGLYEPAVAMLSSLMMGFFNYFLLPLFIFSVVFSIVSNLSNSVKLNKFVSFLNSLFKWAVGLIFTVFMGFLTIQGISSGSVDGLSIRTAKYAIKSYVPIVGGYMSDGLNIILASTSLIKNAIGVAGILLVCSTILSPILELVLFMLALKLMAGIVEPLGDKNIASFLSDLSKSMTMLIAVLVSISFSYIIMIGLIMCTANL